MAHFARIENGTVVEVLVVNDADAATKQDGINFLSALTGKAGWLQTSYSMKDGERKEGGQSLRGTYAGVGFTYDPGLDVFLPPKPFPSWTPTDKGTWKAPKPYPNDGVPRLWSEEAQTWEAVE